MNQLYEPIASLLKSGDRPERVLEEALRQILKHFRSETGTIHRLDPNHQSLHLVVQIGLPPQLLDAVKTIPVGKGIAGQVIAQKKPVTICNLQTDTSGTAQPGAKQTGVGGALCVPTRTGNEINGTLGVGTARPYEYSPEETRALEEIGRTVGDFLKS